MYVGLQRLVGIAAHFLEDPRIEAPAERDLLVLAHEHELGLPGDRIGGAAGQPAREQQEGEAPQAADGNQVSHGGEVYRQRGRMI